MEVELTLGIGSRFIAAGMDFAIQIVVITALGFLLRPAGDAGAVVFTTLSFALIFFYDVLFEVLGRADAGQARIRDTSGRSRRAPDHVRAQLSATSCG